MTDFFSRYEWWNMERFSFGSTNLLTSVFRLALAGIRHRGERDTGSENDGVAGNHARPTSILLCKSQAKKFATPSDGEPRQETEVVETKASRGPHLTIDRAGMIPLFSSVLCAMFWNCGMDVDVELKTFRYGPGTYVGGCHRRNARPQND